MIMVIGHVCIAVQSWKSRKREKMHGIFSILLNFCRLGASILGSTEPAVNVYPRGTQKYIGLRHFFPAKNRGLRLRRNPSDEPLKLGKRKVFHVCNNHNAVDLHV